MLQTKLLPTTVDGDADGVGGWSKTEIADTVAGNVVTDIKFMGPAAAPLRTDIPQSGHSRRCLKNNGHAQ